MKRSFIALVSCMALVAPSISSAAYYQTPSDLLQAMEFDGRARDFSMEVHVGSDPDNMYASAWLNGMAEGVTPQAVKAKINATLDINVEGLWMRSRFEMMIHDMNVYMRLQSSEGDSQLVETTDLMNDLTGKWFKIPIDPQELSSMRNHGSPQDVTMLLQDLGGDLQTAAQVDAAIKDTIDNMFSMRREKFATGFAYFLDIKPDFLHHLARVGAQITGEDPVLIMQDPELMMAQAKINEALDAEIKVDTDLEGNMQFGRMGIHWHDAGMHFSMMGSAQRKGAPVYLDVPAQTMSVEELARMLNRAMPSSFMTEDMWMEEDDTWEEEWSNDWDEEDIWTEWEEEEEWNDDMREEDDWDEEDEWDEEMWPEEWEQKWDEEWEEDDMTEQEMEMEQKWDDGYYGPSREIKQPTYWNTPRSRRGQSWNSVDDLPPGCDAMPGTALYLQQVRKGLCPRIEDSRPGRGTRRRS